MPDQPTQQTSWPVESAPGGRADDAQSVVAAPTAAESELAADEMPCPVCGAAMPDLKGGKATICPVCGFKDSCCF